MKFSDKNIHFLNAFAPISTTLSGIVTELKLKQLLNVRFNSYKCSRRARQELENSVKEIEDISGKTVDKIAIVGGGCKDKYLNRLTKQYTGKRVTAGPVEGTAAGNLIAQLMYLDKDLDLMGARQIIVNTFDIQEV